jgi:cyclophilin family peptidyl-prolyl cis-trans isomerase
MSCLRSKKSHSRIARAVESLEPRRLFNATLTSGFSPVQIASNGASQQIDLSAHFNDPTITGSPAVIQTNEGNIFLDLFIQKAPNTVANFLAYADNGSYDQTVIQRAVPGFVLQGGGFTADQNHIPTGAPINNEASVSNTTGTIAMALGTDPSTHQTDPNSATSDWFINDADNTQLDPQKFTVLGKVIYDGMSVVNAIEALPKGAVSPNFVPNVSAGDPSGGVLPLRNYNDGAPILPTNYVFVSLVRSVLPLNYTVTSDNTSILDVSVSGQTLTLLPHAGSGIAHVTIKAGDLAGNIAQSVLTVQVGSTQAVLGQGAARIVHFTDPDGTASQISFSGPGTATVAFSGTGLTATPKGSIVTISGTPQGVFVTTSGTSAGSSLIITGRGGNGKVDLGGITTDGPLRAIAGTNTALTGNLTAASSIGSVTLATLSNGQIGLGAGRAANIKLGTSSNSSIFSAAPLGSVTIGAWNTGGTISATTIAKVAINGAFAGILDAGSIKNLSAGSITGGSWNVTGALSSVLTRSITGLTAALGTLGKLTALGAITSSTIKTTGNMTSISAASATGSTFFAGIVSTALPAQAIDFSAVDSIGAVKITGSFVNTNIAAQLLGRLILGTIQTANNGTAFGAAGHQIKSLQANVEDKPVKMANVTSQSQVDADLTGQGVTPQDLSIRVI